MISDTVTIGFDRITSIYLDYIQPHNNVLMKWVPM